MPALSLLIRCRQKANSKLKLVEPSVDRCALCATVPQHRPPTSPVARCAALPFIGCLLSFCLAVGSCFGQLRARFLPISNFHFNYYEYYSENQASGNIGDPPNTSPMVVSRQRQLLHLLLLVACHLPPVFDTLLPRSLPSLLGVCVCWSVIIFHAY